MTLSKILSPLNNISIIKHALNVQRFKKVFANEFFPNNLPKMQNSISLMPDKAAAKKGKITFTEK